MYVLDLGILEYGEALGLQEKTVSRRLSGDVPDTIIMLEHYPVLTLGRLSEDNSILDIRFFEKFDIPVIRTRRGGKITYHAPGQLVIYPIIDLRKKLKDVSFFVDVLERAVSASLNALGVRALPGGDRRGVWVDGGKIAFIGVAFKNWVAYHGVAVNINNDISPFERIDPCGEKGIKVTSAAACLGRDLDMKNVKKVFASVFAAEIEKEYGNVLEIT